MRTSFTILIALCLAGGIARAQETGEEGTKHSDKYVGIQANQLIRQLLNFGGSSSVATNPFLLTYSVNSPQTGWGFASGIGYTHSEVKSGDPISPLKSTINDFFMRLGFEKKSSIGKKWLFSAGMDLVLQGEKDKTESGSQFGSFSTETKRSGFGLGPRVTLNYMISDRILLGTEASYYYKSLKEEQKLDGVSQGGKDTLNQLDLSVPAVIYLIVKF